MFVSNTGISTSHNNRLVWNRGETRTFRVLLRPEEPGRHLWRFGFSNTVDSTWDDGSESYADLPGGRFEIVSSSAGTADADRRIGALSAVEWPESTIMSGVCAVSKEIELDVPADGYVVFSWCLRALEDRCVLPMTPDSQALCFSASGDVSLLDMSAFHEDQDAVLPDLFAADRPVRAVMAFMGDSITQGCGTRVNYYEQWATRIAMGMEKDVAVWNIGLGFGRAADAVRNGAWLRKAKQADVVNLCFGVNDILQTGDVDLLLANLERTVSLLRENGTRVVLFTIPPFEMVGESEASWRHAVGRIRTDGLGADAVFDIAAMLSQSEPRDNFAAFGGHPDGRGGAAVAGDYLTAFWPLWRERLLPNGEPRSDGKAAPIRFPE